MSKEKRMVEVAQNLRENLLRRKVAKNNQQEENNDRVLEKSVQE